MTVQAVASMPMYNFAPMHDALDQYWRGIRQGLQQSGVGVNSLPSILPTSLIQPDDLVQHWIDPALLISQTCGYPYISELHSQVSLVGTPDFGLCNGQSGWYDSQIVVRRDDVRTGLEQFEGAVFAYNSTSSQSGYYAMMHTVLEQIGERQFFSECVVTGSHRSSAVAVAHEQADIAAIDSMTWQLLSRYSQEAAHLRVLGTTSPTPGLPYITALSNDAGKVANAVETAIDSLSIAHRQILGLKGLVRFTRDDFMMIAERADQCTGLINLHGEQHQ